MVTIYGLKNCDTCRKAVKWLTDSDIAHDFIDIRAATPPKTEIAGWIKEVGLATILNKSSTTWRQLEPEQRDGLSEENAATLLTDNPTLIKRPVFVSGKKIIVGFKESQKTELNQVPN